MGELPAGIWLWFAGLLREQAFWQVVTILLLLAALVALGPRLGVQVASAALP